MVNQNCALYDEFYPQWKIMRDCIKGELAIKAGGEDYLPRNSGNTDAEYYKYKQRVHWFDATSRTAEGLYGLVFEKSPQITGDISDVLRTAAINNVDNAGTSLDRFVYDLFFDCLQTGWGAILVDHPDADGVIRQSDGEGLQAYMKYYTAENIINWKYGIKNGQQQLTMVVLSEPQERQMVSDIYCVEVVQKYRVLLLEDGKYIQRVYSEDDDYRTYIESMPLIQGKPLTEIPIVFCPSRCPEKPLLLGLAFQNINHYQLLADLNNALHVLGTPTLFVLGTPPNKDEKGNVVPIKIGATANYLWNDGSSSVDVKWVGIEGGLSDLTGEIKNCETRMINLGSQILDAKGQANVTATATTLSFTGSNSALKAHTIAMSECVTLACRTMLKWRGFSDDDIFKFNYALNTDFSIERMGSAELAAWVSAVQSGAVTRREFFHALQQGEMMPDGLDFDTHLTELETESVVGTEANGG